MEIDGKCWNVANMVEENDEQFASILALRRLQCIESNTLSLQGVGSNALTLILRV